MLEVLPAIDLRGGRCVRLRQGDYAQETVFSDDPAEMARLFAAEGATRLHLVDLDAAKSGQPTNVDAVRAILDAVDIPCQLGGGLRTADTIAEWMRLGLDRGIVGTAAVRDPDWFAEVCERFPGRLVLGLDARDGLVATEGWLETSSVTALQLAKRFVDLPLAAVVYTNIANDGMMQGIDPDTLDQMRSLAQMGLPVIASGGVTTLDDLRRLAAIHAAEPNLIGAITGRALYDGAFTVAEAIAAVQETPA